MYRYTLEVDGMMCGMCEAHVNETVRKNFDVKKVKSSVNKRETVIECENLLDEDKLKKAIDDTGYSVINIYKEEIGKKGLFGFLKN